VVTEDAREESVFDRLGEMAGEYERLERELADPAVHADQAKARAIGRRYAELGSVVHAYQEWRKTVDDGQAARELAAEDPSFTAEAEQLEQRQAELEERLQRLLVPRDPADGKDVILEVKAGEGGEESALFAGDLLRMYLRYAQRRGWQTEILDSTPSDLGGFKDVTVAVKAGRRGAAAAARAAATVRPTGTDEDGVWARLKHEGGVHRVQRVPVTESQGRIHTSAAGVLVLPEADEVEVQIDPNDLRVDVFRSSGPGGQSVNTTDSAVRITHLPTGIVVSCQNEKSQLQNKEQALRILRARLLAEARQEADAQAAAERRSQVRTVDRSERVRTYNFPENRISDHRVGYKAYNLDQVIDGDLDAVIQALADADLGGHRVARR
jgi:peptide chain release factor 1